MSTTAPRADARRNSRRLLQAATQILGENPQATMEEIADAAEIHRSTIYRRYPTRDALIEALLQSAREEIITIVTTASQQSPSPQALRDMCHALIGYGSRYAFLNNHYHQADLGSDPFQLAEIINRYQTAGLIRSDQPAAWLASAFEALAVDLIENKRAIATSPDHAAELLYDTFLHGAATQPTRTPNHA